jgi:hypothetical protein
MTEKTEKRGRPKSNKNTLDTNGLLCEHLTTKTDKYDNEVSYYKVIDKNVKNKMSSILAQQCDECKMPFWKTEDSEYILKVKKKYAPKKDLEDHDIVTVNIVFKYYCMETDDDKLLQGYYIKNLTYEEEKEN